MRARLTIAACLWMGISCGGLVLAASAPAASQVPANDQPTVPVTAAPRPPGPAPAPVLSGPAIEALIGRRIADVRLERLGQAVSDARLMDLLVTRAGAALSMRDVRDSLLHLFNTGLFQDVNVTATLAPAATIDGSRVRPADPAAASAAGVTLTYQLTPARTVVRYDFRGDLGLSSSDLRKLLVDRFGARPPLGRVQAAVAALEARYKDAGYLNARVASSVESITPETVSLVMTVASGPRARIGRIEVRGQGDLQAVGIPSRDVLQSRLGLEPGKPFDNPELQRRIARQTQELRNRGYYEATIAATQSPRDEGQTIDLIVTVDPGSRVNVRIEGTQLTASRQEELVPVRREGTIDEDLLEDSKRRIESYLRARGHWRAQVSYARRPTPAGVDLVFTVNEGPIFRIAHVEVSGGSAIARAEIDKVLGLSADTVFVESEVDAKTAALQEHYRRAGFRLVEIHSEIAWLERAPPGRPGEGTGWVDVRLAIAEGPQTRVGALTIAGNQAADAEAVRAVLGMKPGAPFYEPQIAGDREAVQSFYLNRGFDRVQVSVSTAYSRDATRADLTYTIDEGTQLFIDRVLIVGNRRTATATIEKSLTIEPGEPLGLSSLFESQRRLSALGLFRRVRITDVGEPGETRRDVIVTVDEAPTTTIGYGAGVEAGRRLGTGQDASAQEKIDLAARGFFEVSRRNLFGSNRSVTLFTRGSLRPREDVPSQDTTFGFNEYRVLATLRDPDVLNTTIDAQVSGYFEQAVRTSFNFRRRGIQTEWARRLDNRITLVGSYSFNQTELFDDRISDEERPDIDRLFPQVRLSIFSAAARRDTRDDVLDPTRGTVLGLDTDVAARALGSEVGFVRGFGELFWYRQVPNLGRSVFATGVRLGLAKGFARTVPREIEGVPVVGPDGQPLVDVITDLPASERFFGGGDTTVRGYARDTLGDPATISRGFPRGGNALFIVNGELRVPVWRDFGSAVFFDLGNVYSRVSDFDFERLRPTAGFGLRYRSPIGPIRVDLGFKLDRGRFDRPVNDPFFRREPLTEFHISIGQAF